jgi:hypothetical protein
MNRLPASPIAGSSKKSSWSDVIGEMFGGQDRDDEVTRTELVDWNRDENSRIVAQHSPRNKRDCAAAGVCAKEIKPELNTLTRPTSLEMVITPVGVEKRDHWWEF